MTTEIKTKDEFLDEGKQLFGPDYMNWKFICPACGHIASFEDYKKVHAPVEAVGFNCIGRYLKYSREAFGSGPGPCNYTSGGLIRISPINIEGSYYFDFARPDQKTNPQ